jgi:hypothetical protein
MGNALRIRVVRPHWNSLTQQWELIVLHDSSDTTSSGFGAQILTINEPVTIGEPISIEMTSPNFGTFALDMPSGVVNYV